MSDGLKSYDQNRYFNRLVDEVEKNGIAVRTLRRGGDFTVDGVRRYAESRGYAVKQQDNTLRIVEQAKFYGNLVNEVERYGYAAIKLTPDRTESDVRKYLIQKGYAFEVSGQTLRIAKIRKAAA